jgi:hypothetical protein
VGRPAIGLLARLAAGSGSGKACTLLLLCCQFWGNLLLARESRNASACLHCFRCTLAACAANVCRLLLSPLAYSYSNVVLLLQELLDTPNDKSPAQSDAYVCFTQRLNDYRKEIRKQSLKYPPPN